MDGGSIESFDNECGEFSASVAARNVKHKEEESAGISCSTFVSIAAFAK